MEIKVQKIKPGAKLPSYAHSNDAGMDIFSIEDVEILPGKIAQIKTGLAFELPSDCVGLVWDKSGLSQIHGLKTLGGVLDAGYRGELMVGLINLSNKRYLLEKGHKVAQLLIQKIEITKIVEVDILGDSSRGAEGFGSTGK